MTPIDILRDAARNIRKFQSSPPTLAHAEDLGIKVDRIETAATDLDKELRIARSHVICHSVLLRYAEEQTLTAREERDEAIAVLRRAQEELRLIRSKDCDRVYDVTLRFEIDAILAKAGAKA